MFLIGQDFSNIFLIYSCNTFSLILKSNHTVWFWSPKINVKRISGRMAMSRFQNVFHKGTVEGIKFVTFNSVSSFPVYHQTKVKHFRKDAGQSSVARDD